MKTINQVNRKTIRYLMFCKRDGRMPDPPIVGKMKDKSILKYYEDQDGFLGWDKFETHWDIGFGDDFVAKINRPNKWFLVGHDKTEIVHRPENYWEKEAERQGVSTLTLFMQEANRRNIDVAEFMKLINT